MYAPRSQRRIKIKADPSGNIEQDFSAQVIQAFRNIEAILAAAQMTTHNIVKVTYYLVRSDDFAELIKIRSEMWAGVSPAVTTLIVAGLADKDYLVEVEVLAQEEASNEISVASTFIQESENFISEL